MKTMLSIKTLFVTLLLFAAPFIQRAGAQINPTPLPVVAGSGAQLSSSIAGTAGTTAAYYVVMTNFVGGSVPSNILYVGNSPNTLSASNFVSFQWGAVPGAVTYDLLKLASASLPSGTNSVLLHGGLNVTTSVDQGTMLTGYTAAAAPSTPVGSLFINSRDYTQPQFDFETLAGTTIAGDARNGVPLPVITVTTSASATGITIANATLINGILIHAAGGAVNDTTDTAAHIVAALPSCYVSGTTSTKFTFSLINTTSGPTAITLVGGTNVTIVGTAAVAQNFVTNFIGYVTACTGTPAVKLQSIGTTAF